MEIKIYKYNQSIKKYNQIFEKSITNNELGGFLLLQSNGITGQDLNKLTQSMLYNNIEVCYLNNIMKKKLVHAGLYNVKIMNNDLFLIKCNNILKDYSLFFKYARNENLEDILIPLNLLLNYNNKLQSKSISYYNKYLKTNNCFSKGDLYGTLFKTIKLKLFTILLKLKQLLNANIQSIKTTKN